MKLKPCHMASLAADPAATGTAASLITAASDAAGKRAAVANIKDGADTAII